jgi:hypothetical protein
MTTKEELESLKKQIATLEAKIAQEEKQKIKTCEDAWNKFRPTWYISNYGTIYQVNDEMLGYTLNQCNMTSEKEAKRMKALIQLRLIAEAMNEGVDGNNYWFIGVDLKANYSAVQSSLVMLAPIFKTEQLAEQALKNFRPLFEDLYV